jgi:catechol 2,3-dioxygenase-like lactoylglutathione lyase family enzyme
MDWTLEVVVVPVGDVDRDIGFYREGLGFNLDHDTRAGDQRFALGAPPACGGLTAPGSGCSIVLSDPPPMPRGSLKGVQLVVADAHRAREQLLERGDAAGDIDVIDERAMFGFTDPDGNSPPQAGGAQGSYKRSGRGGTELKKTDDPGWWGDQPGSPGVRRLAQ